MKFLEYKFRGGDLVPGPYLLAFLLIAFYSTCVPAQVSEWLQLAPGAGGQIQDVYFDPTEDETIWLSSDVDGTYRSSDYGESWEFVSRTLLHGMSFKVRRAPFAGSTLWQGGLYGAHKSTDGGTTWTFVEATRADAIATIALSPDGQTVVLAPSWHTKDNQKQSPSQTLPLQDLTGPRTVYVSRDGGANFTAAQYEAVDGYRQVFGAFVHPTTGVIYLGSAAGFYRSTNAAGTQYERVDNPTSARAGARGGINSIPVFDAEGDLDQNGYRWSSACLGIGFTPDGSQAFASYQTSDRGWQVFTTPTAQLGTADPGWESLSTTGSGTGLDTLLRTDVMWYNLRVDPRSSSTSVKLLAGVTFLEGRNRRGLYEGTLALNNGEVTTKSWQQIMYNRNPKDTLIWKFDDGWEDPSFITRAYDYTPVSWGERRIIAGGGNTFYLSTDPAAPGWPYTADSWLAIYTRKVSSGPLHDTYTHRGMVNTVSYDLDAYGDYAIQGNADHGILESFDGGVSWTKEAGGVKTSNSQSVIITKTEPPIVLADSRQSFGVPRTDVLNLRARLLTNPGEQVADEVWRQLGGNGSNGEAVAGLPNRIIKDFALDDCHPSRVYAGLGVAYQIGGIYATEEIEEVYAGNARWREISNAEMRRQSAFNDLFVDPNDSDVLWAAGNHLYKGTRTAAYTWSWAKSAFSIGDLYVWDNNGTTVVGFVAELNGGPQQLHVLTDPTTRGISGTKAVGLTPTESLQLRPEPWLDPILRERISIEGLAGYGNKIIATTVVSVFKKGLGIFEGTISGTGANTTVDWQSYSEDETGNDLYYTRDGTADAKIIKQQDGKLYYTLPTFGTGVWWRYVGTDTSQSAIAVDRSGLRFPQQGGTARTVALTASGNWSITNSLPNWIEQSAASGSGDTTLTFTTTRNNPLPYTRSARVRIAAGGKTIELTLTQEGRPAQVGFSSGAFVVNGFEESAWNGVAWNNLRQTIVGSTTDRLDRVKFAYNRNSLFALVQVFDSTPLAGDSLLVGLDIGNTKGTSVRKEDLFFHLDPSGKVTSSNPETVSRVRAAARQVSDGYLYEFAVDWDDLDVIPYAGTTLGVDLKVSDDQTGDTTTIEHVSQFYAGSDLATNLPVNWGTAELTGSDLPWFEDFQFVSGVTEDDGPTAWTIDATGIDPTGVFAVERSSKGTRFEARKLRVEAAWFSEVIDISTAEFVKVGLDVFEVGGNAGNYLRVYAKLDGGPEELILALEGDTPEDETRTRLQTNGLAGQTIQLVVRAFNNAGGTAYYFENVLVDFGEATNCPAPTSPSVAAVNENSVDLTWTASLNGLALFEVGYRQLGTDTFNVVTVSNENTLTIANLSPETTYEWRIRRNCPGEVSGWADGPAFTTPAPLERQDLYYETFDLAGCNPTNAPVADYPCYREQGVTYSGQLTFSDQFASTGYGGASGNQQAFLTIAGDQLRVEGINTTNFANLELSFGVRKNSRNDNGASLTVELVDGEAVVATLPVVVPTADTSNGVWYLISSPASLSIPATDQLGLRFTTTGNTKWKIDDIRIAGQQGDDITCNAPQSPQTLSVGATGATISWGSVPTATGGFELALQPLGGSYGDVIPLMGTEYAFTDLQEGTEYAWRVRSRCEGDTRSDWVTGSFTTTVPGTATLFREEHDREGCADGSSIIDNYTCYSAPGLDHDGTGIINGSQSDGTYPGASRGKHAFLRSQGQFYAITGADGSAFTDMSLDFAVRKNQSAADGSLLRVEVTTDGGTSWTRLPITLPTEETSRDVWHPVRVAFPTPAGGNVGVRFTADGNTRYRIDDIEVSGITTRNAALRSGTPKVASVATEGEVRLYPNPARDRITVVVPPTTHGRLRVVDVQGRRVLQRSITEESATTIDLPLADLPRGLYLLLVEDATRSWSLKFHKQ